jgi:hypothetical protein
MRQMHHHDRERLAERVREALAQPAAGSGRHARLQRVQAAWLTSLGSRPAGRGRHDAPEDRSRVS